MSRIIASGRGVQEFSAPPAVRMAGRPSRVAAAQAVRQAVRAAAPARAAAAAAASTKPSPKPTQTRAERENLLDRAVHAGVISSNLRAHYSQAFDADPAGTRAFLGKIGLRAEAAPAASPAPTPAASAASGPEDYDQSLLTDGERARIQAAREGKQPGGFIHGGL